jgi:polyhydroxyalkanoate synthesis regulator phasin
MILVETPPNVIPAVACPVTRVRVLNQLGKTLRVASYDMLSNSLIGETTYSIDSSDKTFLVTWATPTQRTLMLAVLEVYDGTTLVERWAQPFIYIPNATVLNLPSSDYNVAYICKVGGVTKLIDNTNVVFLDAMNITVVRKSGYLAIYDGVSKIVEVTGKSAIFELSIQVPRDIAKAFSNYVDYNAVASVIYKEYTLAEYLGALAYVKLLTNNLRFTNVGTTVYELESGDFIVKCRFYADLYSPIDWHRILAILSGIASIIAGFTVAIMSLGASLPVSISMIISGIAILSGTALVLSNALAEAPSQTIAIAESVTAKATNEITSYKNSLYSYLDTLVSQGRLTSDEANTVKSYVDSIVNASINSINELNTLVKKAYEEGYNKARSDFMKWLIVSGLGGFVGGYYVGKSK